MIANPWALIPAQISSPAGSAEFDHAHERVAPGGVVHDLVLLVVGVAVLPEERAAVGGRLARDHRRGAGASVVHEGHAESDCQAEAQEQEGAIHILRGHDSSLERGWVSAEAGKSVPVSAGRRRRCRLRPA